MPEEPEPTDEEWAAIEAADAYLDAVGGGLDIPGDVLGATELRQDVDREPVAWPNFPSAHTASGQPPAPTEGNPVSDSIADRARQLMALADQAPSAELQQLMLNVNAWNAQAQAILGEGATGAMLVNQMTQQVIQTCGELLEGIERMRQVARETGGGHLGG